MIFIWTGISSVPAGKEEISASFGKQIFAVPWTWERFSFPGPPGIFTIIGRRKGDLRAIPSGEIIFLK
jgi:hypothetical protein